MGLESNISETGSQVNYIKTILQCFARMDIKGLYRYLRDDYSYQEASRDVFLEKVSLLFKKYRQAGDTELLMFAGTCRGEGCESCGNGGYRFIGNVSRNYTDLVVIADHVKDDILDIYSCSSFESHGLHSGELNEDQSIYIHWDERIDFQSTPEYWSLVQAAEIACDDLIQTRLTEYELPDLDYWVKKHADTVQRIKDSYWWGPDMRWTPFIDLYEDTSVTFSYFTRWQKELDAAEQELPGLNTEDEILQWLLRYEPVYGEFPFWLKCRNSCFDAEGNRADIKLVPGPTLARRIALIRHYQELYERLFRKYNTYTEEETSEIISNEKLAGLHMEIFKLSYHMQKRKTLGESGITMPFYP